MSKLLEAVKKSMATPLTEAITDESKPYGTHVSKSPIQSKHDSIEDEEKEEIEAKSPNANDAVGKPFRYVTADCEDVTKLKAAVEETVFGGLTVEEEIAAARAHLTHVRLSEEDSFTRFAKIKTIHSYVASLLESSAIARGEISKISHQFVPRGAAEWTHHWDGESWHVHDAGGKSLGKIKRETYHKPARTEVLGFKRQNPGSVMDTRFSVSAIHSSGMKNLGNFHDRARAATALAHFHGIKD